MVIRCYQPLTNWDAHATSWLSHSSAPSRGSTTNQPGARTEFFDWNGAPAYARAEGQYFLTALKQPTRSRVLEGKHGKHGKYMANTYSIYFHIPFGKDTGEHHLQTRDFHSIPTLGLPEGGLPVLPFYWGTVFVSRLKNAINSSSQCNSIPSDLPRPGKLTQKAFIEAMAQSKSWIFPAITWWMFPSFFVCLPGRVYPIKIPLNHYEIPLNHYKSH